MPRAPLLPRAKFPPNRRLLPLWRLRRRPYRKQARPSIRNHPPLASPATRPKPVLVTLSQAKRCLPNPPTARPNRGPQRAPSPRALGLGRKPRRAARTEFCGTATLGCAFQSCHSERSGRGLIFPDSFLVGAAKERRIPLPPQVYRRWVREDSFTLAEYARRPALSEKPGCGVRNEARE